MQQRKQIYMECIDDVALEISISRVWRKRIFALKPGEVLRLSFRDADIPEYVKDIITQNELTFEIRSVHSDEQQFDEGLTVFRFSSQEYPDVVSFSGNNPSVI